MAPERTRAPGAPFSPDTRVISHQQGPMNRIQSFVAYVKRSREFGPLVAYHREIPARAPSFQELSPSLPEEVSRALSLQGVQRLYTHQVQAIDAVRRSLDVVVSTPTSSGKTLIYTIPVLERAGLEPGNSCALFVFPLKALEQDQWRMLTRYQESLGSRSGFRSAVYDGDTSPYQRKHIRSTPPNILITNPDMLHMGILSSHESWEPFFRNLRFVVLDEVHTYRGIFGSHMAQIVRRLLRIAACYGASPSFVLSSATISNPGEFSRRITGRTFHVVSESGAPQAARHFLFLNPELSSQFTACRLLVRCLREGLKTIVFTRSRRATELIHMWTEQSAPEFASKVSSYRAGFLPEERRFIEEELSSGRMMGVVSTSALEMGIDIGGLDVCILVGYPGTVMATWQRGGRVGREERDSVVILVAQPDALDQYFMRHPEDFFQRAYERAVADPENSEVVKAHLVCAAAELPLNAHDPFFPTDRYVRLITELEAAGHLVASADGSRWSSASRKPHRGVNIRSVGESYTVMRESTRSIIGRVEGIRAFRECHPGAVYLHRAAQYEVTSFDLDAKKIMARKVQVPYYTRAETDKDTEILEYLRSRPCANFLIKQGRVRVTERITGYEKRKIRGQELLSKHALELPEQIFETMGIWVEIDEIIQTRVTSRGFHFMGGIHALEHAAISMFPLLALCDRDDIGGISYPFHPQLGKSAVFLYDGYPGGVGLVEQGFDLIEELLEKTLALVAGCGCEDGCPSCIHSPKCGSGNKPLDKHGCILVLELLLGKKPLAVAGAPTIRPAEEEQNGSIPEPKARIGFLDVETQRSFEEVGGWRNRHLMRVAVAVLYDLQEERFLEYTESDVGDLVNRLVGYDLVVGFNIKEFDYGVLKAYTGTDLTRIPTFDMLEDIHRKLGFRVSLDRLASTTLNTQKSGDGLQSIEWFRTGQLDKVVAYCRKDVEITRDLFLFGVNRGYIRVDSRNRGVTDLKVDWNFQQLSGDAQPISR